MTYNINKTDLNDIKTEFKKILYYSHFLFNTHGISRDGIFNDINMYDLYSYSRNAILFKIKDYKKSIYINNDVFDVINTKFETNNISNAKEELRKAKSKMITIDNNIEELSKLLSKISANRDESDPKVTDAFNNLERAKKAGKDVKILYESHQNKVNTSLTNITFFEDSSIFNTENLSIINLLYYLDIHYDIIENAMISRINERYRRHTIGRLGWNSYYASLWDYHRDTVLKGIREEIDIWIKYCINFKTEFYEPIMKILCKIIGNKSFNSFSIIKLKKIVDDNENNSIDNPNKQF